MFIKISAVSATTQEKRELFMYGLFLNPGSGVPFPSNKREQFTLVRREPSLLTLEGNLPDFGFKRIRAPCSKLNYDIFIF